MPTTERTSPPSAGTNSAITICPECGGVLSEYREAGAVQWRYRVGHRYSPESLVDAQASDVEAALGTAVRALEDRTVLLERLADQLSSRGQRHSARRFRQRARDAADQATLVRRALAEAARGALSTEESAPGEDEERTA